MSKAPVDITADILIRLREDIAEFRTSVEARLDRLEKVGAKQRRDQAAMLVMMRGVVADFDQRVSEVEERVLALEAAER